MTIMRSTEDESPRLRILPVLHCADCRQRMPHAVDAGGVTCAACGAVR